MMRFFRETTSVCQNCVHGNNEKGKRITKRFNKTIGWNDDDSPMKDDWHVYCEKKKKFIRWNKFKRCFQKKIVKREEKLNF